MTAFILTCDTNHLHLQETLSTLRFGKFAKKLRNKIRANKEISVDMMKQIICELETQVLYYKRKEKENNEKMEKQEKSLIVQSECQEKEGVLRQKLDECERINDVMKSQLDSITEERDMIRSEFEVCIEDMENGRSEFRNQIQEVEEKFLSVKRQKEMLVFMGLI